jgi:signal transduction histidine kinase
VKLFKVLMHRPWVLPMAVAAAVAMVAISEVAYWQSMDTLRSVALETITHDTPSLAQHRLELWRSLMLARVGVAVLSLISLVALYRVMRQGLALQSVAQAHAKTLEATVALRTSELRELTHHLQTAREDERSRLARDLHDELGALLTAAKLDAARIRSRLVGTATLAGAGVHTVGVPEALERLAHLVKALDSVIALKRRITEDLRPSALSHLGLVATLEILAREFEQASGTRVHCDLQPVPLAPAAELMVYRLVQESVNNISKHAQAHQVWIKLGLLPGSGSGAAAALGPVCLVVRDDGVGFDTRAQPRSAHGLLGMRYRVEAEQGTLQVTSAPGQGTRIEVQLPAAQAGMNRAESTDKAPSAG